MALKLSIDKYKNCAGPKNHNCQQFQSYELKLNISLIDIREQHNLEVPDVIDYKTVSGCMVSKLQKCSPSKPQRCGSLAVVGNILYMDDRFPLG